MQYCRFALNERPMCVWDMDIKKLNSDFIKAINSDYYEFIAESNLKIIDDKEADKKDKVYASVNLRIHYSLALETLFALIGALLQATDCIPGWLLKYRISELKSLVKKINKNLPIKTRFSKIEKMSWESVARVILNYYPNTDNKLKEETIKNYSTLFHNFANDLLNERFQNEYNSIKHAFRIGVGGFSVELVLSTKDEKVLEGAKNIQLTQSDYGATFNYEEKLKKSPTNIRLKNLSRNWNPENFYHALRMIGVSIFNIRMYLAASHKIDIKDLHYKLVKPENFKAPWKEIIGLGDWGFDSGFNYDSVRLLTDKQIMSVYDS